MKNLTVRGPLPAALCLCAHFLLCSSAEAGAPFTTVINVPADPAPAYIGSDTQLNLFDGGGLPDNFSLGDQLYGPNTHIEVNINGGTVGNGVNIGMPDIFPLSSNADIVMNVYGGTIGHGLTVNADSTFNFYGGTIGPNLEVDSGATVNLFSGSLGDNIAPKNGSTFNISGGTIGSNFAPENNTTVNISGGKIGDLFSLGYNTKVNISGGVVPEIIYVGGDGVLNLSGGNIGAFYANGTDTMITGSEFMLDGVPIAGLNGPGDSVTIPTSGGARLTTTFADGAVFTSVPDNLGDTLTLVAVAAPPKPLEINSPSDPVPLGLRAGQTLNLGNGAELVDNFVAVDATLNITGGTASDHLITLGTEVHISEGSVGDYFQARSGSMVNIDGGQIGLGMKIMQSEAVITAGAIDSLEASAGSTVEIHGGEVNILHANPGSTVSLFGLSFMLNGLDITHGLQPGEAFTIPDRDVMLQGQLLDGSLFSFALNSPDVIGSDYFDPNATLTVTLVPEPGTFILFIAGGLAMIRNKRHCL